MQKLLILDYGSQYTQLIARRIREFHVYSEVSAPDSPLDLENVWGIILSGGPASVNDSNAPDLPPVFSQIIKKKIPVLGICYGFQLLAKRFGGVIAASNKQEYGKCEFRVSKESPLFEGLPKHFLVWMSHGDSVIDLPSSFPMIGDSEEGGVSAAEYTEGPIYGIQFHPEVAHTHYGNQILENFLFQVCSFSDRWELQDYIMDTVSHLRKTIGDHSLVSGFSGGVDSSVASVLTHRAVGKQLTNILIDTGFLRKNEAKEVNRVFSDSFQMEIRTVDAKGEFFQALKGVVDREIKRKRIGETFIRVFEREAKKIPNHRFLVQGTIYSDVIESAHSNLGNASQIKSHHNVGGLPNQMSLELIEPIRYLFKDEVRKVGAFLKIPESMLQRHPFPGPGLAIRCLGEVTEEKIRILQNADALFLETLREMNWYDQTWQAFSVLLNSKSVGVVGDKRTYGYTLALRGVNSIEGMTADWTRFPYDLLDRASRRITNQIPEINRVVYDITSKPPGTIEWE